MGRMHLRRRMPSQSVLTLRPRERMPDASCWKSGNDTENEFASLKCSWRSLIVPLPTIASDCFMALRFMYD